MKAQLEEGLTLVATLPECIHATFTHLSESASAQDDRGEAFVFERLQSPAVLVEIIATRPLKVRGNHIHQTCEESFTVLSGKLELHLLCDCPGRHVYSRVLEGGDIVRIAPGIAHAVFSLEETQFAALFDADPRHDRERVPILKFTE